MCEGIFIIYVIFSFSPRSISHCAFFLLADKTILADSAAIDRIVASCGASAFAAPRRAVRGLTAERLSASNNRLGLICFVGDDHPRLCFAIPASAKSLEFILDWISVASDCYEVYGLHVRFFLSGLTGAALSFSRSPGVRRNRIVPTPLSSYIHAIISREEINIVIVYSSIWHGS